MVAGTGAKAVREETGLVADKLLAPALETRGLAADGSYNQGADRITPCHASPCSSFLSPPSAWWHVAAAAARSRQCDPAPKQTSEGYDAVIPPAANTAAWLRSVVSEELDDRYGSTLTVTDAICVNTDHGSSKCSVMYAYEGGRHRVRIVVHYVQGMPTFEVVDEVEA
jgi:hypothetical protein